MATSDEIRPLMEGLIGVPFTGGNEVTRLRNGDEIFPAMLEAIGAAEKRVDLLTFVYWSGHIAERFAEALAERARAGVRVRVLLDSFGAQAMPEHLCTIMKDAGVDLKWFRPLYTWRVWRTGHRSHRKVLVVDDEIGFTGGVGIAAEWEGDARDPSEWRDDHFRVRGPAVIGLKAAFASNWVETGGHVADEAAAPAPGPAGDLVVQVVRSEGSSGWSDVASTFEALVSVADERIRIATAYFAPDDKLTELICARAREGVVVEIMIPGPHVDRRLSELSATDQIIPLVEAGVHLAAFQPSMLHLKTITVDGCAACIGSPNLNHRSQYLDDEIALVVLGEELTRILDDDFDADLGRCEPIRHSDLRSRGPLRRAGELALRPFRPHL